jgi:hypothetical protein
MANALYDKSREAFLGGDLDWDAHNFKWYLIDAADYSKNLATDDFADDIPSGAKVATSGNLANKTKTNGVADADDVTLSAVSGDPSEELVLWRDSGSQATSQLVANVDTATGLPVTPNGGDIVIQHDAGASKIFKL